MSKTQARKESRIMEGMLGNNGNGGNIIEVKNLSKQFNLEAGFFAKNKNKVYAVNDVSFSIKRGETYGIVGESGCGKLLRLVS